MMKKEKESNISKRRKLLRPKKGETMSVVQKLYNTCKEVFANGGDGYIPPPPDIQRLRFILDSISPEDVGLSPNMPCFNTTEDETTHVIPITYLHLHECGKFSMGIFCLPACGVIPLHNHPRMVVFSKLLFGTMHVKSYDWASDTDVPDMINNIHQISTRKHHEADAEVKLGKIHRNAELRAPCDTSILYPSAGGNMHCFRALTPCAMLDVLGPPYSESHGRPCTYFHDYPYSTFSVELLSEEDHKTDQFAWLEEREKPNQFVVVGGTYQGPQILES